jgi:hypothetical protein
MKTTNVTIAAALVLGVSAITSHATLAANGGLDVTPGILTGTLSGTLVDSLLNQTLSQVNPLPLGGNDGIISSWVLSGVDPLQGGLGGLTFVYQVENLNSSTVKNVTISGFGSLADVDLEEIASATVTTGSAIGTQSTSDGSFGGDTVTFQNFSTGGVLPSGIPQNTYSYLLIVNTTSSQYNLNQGQIQDGFSAAGQIYAPVPEPTTVLAAALILLPLGIGTVRALRKERTVYTA